MVTNQGYFLRLNVSLRWLRKGARSTKQRKKGEGAVSTNQRKEEKVLDQPNNIFMNNVLGKIFCYEYTFLDINA